MWENLNRCEAEGINILGGLRKKYLTRCQICAQKINYIQFIEMCFSL